MTVGIDTLILLYMFMLAAVMLFNVAYFLVTKTMRDAQRHHNSYFTRRLEGMIGNVERGGRVDRRSRSYLLRALKKTRNMLMFETVTGRYAPPVRALFFKDIGIVFIRLAPAFRERDGLERAYFAHLVQLTRSGEGASPAALYLTLMQGLEEESLYCRDASLKALVTIGTGQTALEALRRINRSRRYYYPKLILQAFNCVSAVKQKRLLDAVVPWYGEFSVEIRIALLKMARKLKCDYREQFFRELSDPETDPETLCELIRYFKVCVYPPAKAELLHILTFPRIGYRQAIIFALWSLKSYYDEETRQRILPLLSVSDTLIQSAAAETLIENGISYYELIEFYNSEDENLRRILKYMREEMRERNLRRIIELMKK